MKMTNLTHMQTVKGNWTRITDLLQKLTINTQYAEEHIPVMGNPKNIISNQNCHCSITLWGNQPSQLYSGFRKSNISQNNLHHNGFLSKLPERLASCFTNLIDRVNTPLRVIHDSYRRDSFLLDTWVNLWFKKLSRPWVSFWANFFIRVVVNLYSVNYSFHAAIRFPIRSCWTAYEHKHVKYKLYWRDSFQ